MLTAHYKNWGSLCSRFLSLLQPTACEGIHPGSSVLPHANWGKGNGCKFVDIYVAYCAVQQESHESSTNIRKTC